MKKSNAVFLVILVAVCIFLVFILPFILAASIEVSADENDMIVSEYTFEKGEIQFITSVGVSHYRYWEAKVYFPDTEENHTVIIPDSVLDDISVGWEGYFGFRPDYSSPQWVGLNYNP